MSTALLTNLDFSHLELLNARVQNLASDPGSPSKGWTYYNTTTNKPRWYNGSTWDELGSGGGSVTSVSVVSANGFNGSVATSTSTPAITITTTITGVLKGNGTAISAATSGTDYAPATSGSSALKGNGAGGFSAATLNDVGAATADYSINSHKLTNLLDPTVAQDAATKNYVDNLAQGIVTKPSAKYTTTAALPANTYSNGTAGVGATLTATSNAALASQDGQTPAANDVILVRNEAAPANNGLYVVTQLGTGSLPYILTRHTSMDDSTEFSGALTAIETGTVNAGALFLVSNTAAPTVGTTSITFTQINGATSLIAAAPLAIAGNTISINANGISNSLLRQGAALSVVGVTGNATANEADIVGTAAQVLRVNTAGTALAFGTVDTAGITAAAVTYAKLQNETTLTLLGNPTGSAAAPSEVTLSADLAFASSVLGIAAATTLTRKYSVNIGDGSTTAIVVTHSLGSRAVIVDVSSATTPWAEVICDVAKTSTNTVTLTFVVAPTTNQYTVTVIG